MRARCYASANLWIRKSTPTNVARLHALQKFDWTQPPNRSQGSSGTGTGFVIDTTVLKPPIPGVYILTAHHVVSNSITIKCHFDRLNPEKQTAVIVGSNPELGVSLLPRGAV